MGDKYTSIYVSVEKEDDIFINEIRKKRIKEDNRDYSKTRIIKEILKKGIDVEKGKYLKLIPEIDEFVSKLQEITIEKNEHSFKYKKSKEQVYYMLIEKGLENLNE